MNFAAQVGVAFIGFLVMILCVAGLTYLMTEKFKVEIGAAWIAGAIFILLFITAAVLASRSLR